MCNVLKIAQLVDILRYQGSEGRCCISNRWGVWITLGTNMSKVFRLEGAIQVESALEFVFRITELEHIFPISSSAQLSKLTVTNSIVVRKISLCSRNSSLVMLSILFLW